MGINNKYSIDKIANRNIRIVSKEMQKYKNVFISLVKTDF